MTESNKSLRRDWIATARTLSEALPNLQRYDNAVVVVKFGGHAMGDAAAMADFARDIVLMKLDIVGLRGARDLMPAELSGGMARRVALARAIVLDPALMMYDEPFTGLDPITLGSIVRLIRTLNQSLGITSMLVSHDIHESLSIADYLCVVAEGKILAQGKVADVQAKDSPWLRQFLSGSSEGPVAFHYPAPDRSDDFLHRGDL